MKHNKHARKWVAFVLAAALVINSVLNQSLFVAASEETTTKAVSEPTTEAPKAATEAPKPTTEAPKPTTEAPKPTTEAPKATTAEEKTTEKKEETTKAEEKTEKSTEESTQGGAKAPTQANDGTTGTTASTTEEGKTNASTASETTTASAPEATTTATDKQENTETTEPEDAVTYKVSVPAAKGATISYTGLKDGETVTQKDGTSMNVAKDSTLSFTITPDTGYCLKEYQYNGNKETVTNHFESITKKDIPVTGDMEITVVCDEIKAEIIDTCAGNEEKSTWLESSKDGKVYSFSHFLNLEPDYIDFSLEIDSSAKEKSTIDIDNTKKEITIPYSASGKKNELKIKYGTTEKSIVLPVKSLKLSSNDYTITPASADFYNDTIELIVMTNSEGHNFNQYQLNETGWIDIVSGSAGDKVSLDKMKQGNNKLTMRYSDSQDSKKNYVADSIEFKLDTIAPQWNKDEKLVNKESGNQLDIPNDDTWIKGNELKIQGTLIEETSGIETVSCMIDGKKQDEASSVKLTDNTYEIGCVEGKHTYTIIAWDKAGNQSEEKEITVQYDNTAPELNEDRKLVDESGNEITINAEKWINGENLRIQGTVKEENSGFNKVDYRAINQNTQEEKTGEIIIDNNNNTYEIPCLEGNYVYYITAWDKALNASDEKNVQVKYDNTKPEEDAYVQYICDDENNTEIAESEKKSLFSTVVDTIKKYFVKNKLKIKVFVRDKKLVQDDYSDVSGIQNIAASIKGYNQDIGWEKLSDSAQIKENTYTVFEASIEAANISYDEFVLDSVEDNAGNVLKGTDCKQIPKDETILYFDNTPPELTVDLTNEGKADKETIYYTDDFTPELYITEANFKDKDGKQNGEIVKNENLGGNWTNENVSPYTYTGDTLTAKDGEEQEYAPFTFAYVDGSKNKMIASNMENVKGGNLDNGIFTSYSFVIDKNAPQIGKIQLKNGDEPLIKDQKNGYFYMKNLGENSFDVNVTIPIKEKYLDSSSIVIKANKLDLNGNVISTIDNLASDKYDYSLSNPTNENVSDFDNEITLKFNEEGIWQILVECKDKAGNDGVAKDENTVGQTSSIFVIDHTAPTLNVSYKPEWNNICNENNKLDELTITSSAVECYIQQPTTVTFSITEKNFDAENVTLIKKYKKDLREEESKEESLQWESSKNSEGDTYTFDVELAEEGRYQIELSYTDKSGNKLIASEKESETGNCLTDGNYTSPTIIVDNTNPVISDMTFDAEDDGKTETDIVKDNKIYLKNVEDDTKVGLDFNINELYLDKETITIIAKNNVNDKQIRVNSKDNPELFTITDGKLEVTKDGKASLNHKVAVVFPMTPKEAADGDWSFTIETMDFAERGQDIEKESQEVLNHTIVVSDFTTPILSVEYGKNWSNVTDSEAVDIKTITDSTVECFVREETNAVFTIIEKNFITSDAIKGVQIHVTYKENDKAKATVTDYDLKQEEWKAVDGKADTYTYVLPLEKEGHYKFTLTYQDPAENKLIPDGTDKIVDGNVVLGNSTITIAAAGMAEGSGTYTSPFITVDKTNPVIQTEFARKPKNTQGGREYYQKAVDMTFTIIEENFRASDFDMDFETYEYNKDGSKGKVTKKKDNNTGKTKAEWTCIWIKDEHGVEKQAWTMTIPWEEEHNYDMAYTYKDLSGRKGSHSDSIAIDGNLPKIVIDKVEGTELSDILFKNGVGSQGLLSFLNYKDYAYFGRDKVFTVITAHDDISGVKSIYYEVIDEKGTVIKKDTMENETGHLGKWTAKTVVLDKDFKGYVQAYAVDRSMNEGDTMSPKGVVSESKSKHKETSTLQINTITKPSRTIGKTKYYNKDVKVNIQIKDSQSGIRSYKYRAGNMSPEGHDYNDDPGSKDVSDSEANNQYTLDKNVVMLAKNNYTSAKAPSKVEVSYTDNAGYTEKKEEEYVIDNKAPEINVKWTPEKGMNEKYYKTTRTATITVTERNFDEDGVEWFIKATNANGYSKSGWSHNGDVHTCTVSFEKDGDYTLGFKITDYATNSYVWDKGTEFVIDKTAPVLSISFDNNSAANGKYYKAPRTATLHIEEHNFNASDVKYEMTASNDGKAIGSPSVGGWSGTEHHTASIHYGTDGDYSLNFTYTDMAGNPAKKISVEEFTIDLTKPVCEITNINDHSANNDVVAPGIKYSDTNLDENKVSVKLVGNKNGSVNYDREAPVVIHNGKTVTWKDFAHKEEVDDIYTMELTVTDKAGNQSKASKLFSVNRFGSNYMFGKETKAKLDKYYNNAEFEVEIHEINVNTLEEKAVTVKDEENQLKPLEEGSDYTVKESSNKYNWKEYTYKINKEVFAEENLYNVNLYSKDAAENKMNNETKDMSVEFVIDKTKPTGVITGLEESSYKTDTHDIDISVMDNYKLDKAVLTVDEEEVKTFGAEEFNNAKQMVSYTLDSKDKPQAIALRITDAAGNETIIDPVNCLISASTWVQFVNNKPLLYTTSGIGAAAILALIGVLTHGFGYQASMAAGTGFWWLLFGKKKEEDDEEEIK